MKLLFDLIYNLTSQHSAVHLGWRNITYNTSTYNTNNTTVLYYIVQHKQNNTITIQLYNKMYTLSTAASV